MPTGPLSATVTDLAVPRRQPAVLPTPVVGLVNNEIRAVEWETPVTPSARLLLPGDQQLKFTVALARRDVTVRASDRSIHVILDGAVIRTRPHDSPNATCATCCSVALALPDPNLPAVRPPWTRSPRARSSRSLARWTVTATCAEDGVHQSPTELVGIFHPANSAPSTAVVTRSSNPRPCRTDRSSVSLDTRWPSLFEVTQPASATTKAARCREMRFQSPPAANWQPTDERPLPMETNLYTARDCPGR